MGIGFAIKELAESFRNRLGREEIKGIVGFDIIEDVKANVDYNEYSLAFRVLCDQLYEFDVKLAKEEFDQIDHLGKGLYKNEEYSWTKPKELVDK